MDPQWISVGVLSVLTVFMAREAWLLRKDRIELERRFKRGGRQ